MAFGIHNNGLELDTTHGTDLSADVALTDGEQLVLRFDHDGYVRLLRPRILIILNAILLL